MEAAGLAIGVAGLVGLFNTCLDIISRVDSYKEFGVESDALRAHFRADTVRFQQWGKSVGFKRGELSDSHHKALDEALVRSAVDQILQSIRNLVGAVGGSASDLVGPDEPSLQDKGASPRGYSHFDEPHGVSSRRYKLGWALRGKARFLALVGSFGGLVQKLYDLVPPVQPGVAGQLVTGGRFPIPNGSSAGDASWASGAQRILADLEKQLHNEFRKTIFDWLDPHSTHIMYDTFVDRRLDGTCDWILDCPKFLQWRSSEVEKAKMFWLHGHAGYGKTILCARIIQHLSTPPNPPLAYFFFSSELGSREDPFVVIRSWLSQIITQDQDAFELAKKKWEATDGQKASRSEIRELLMAVVRNTSNCAFVVDGLDECVGVGHDWMTERKNSLFSFFTNLREAMSGTTSRVMIVSRNEPEIREGLSVIGNDPGWDLAKVQILPADVKSDATAFSRSILDRKLANKSEEQREELSRLMVDKCESMFLGIRLLEDDLGGWENMRQLQRIISKAPTRLERLYDRNWEKINKLREDKRCRAYAILRWVTFALRPMTVAEITGALALADEECTEASDKGLPETIDEIYVKCQLLDLSGPFVESRNTSTEASLDFSTLHLTHYSVRQYILCHLTTPPNQLLVNERLRSSNEARQNNILAKTCLQYLNSTPIWAGTQPQDKNGHILQAFREYAAALWHHHVKPETDNSEDVILLINAFFHPRNTNWESWRKHIGAALEDRILEYQGEMSTGNPLFYASLLGLSKTVTHLVENVGLDVNYVDKSNRTALLAASSKGWILVVEQLLGKGANIKIGTNQGVTPLHVAANGGHSEVIKLLLQKEADLTVTGEFGWTPLMEAAANNHLETVRLLLHKGAGINVADSFGDTPLSIASGNGYLEMVKLLIDKGADLNASDNNGWTSLNIASLGGHLEIVKFFLNKRADINTRSSHEWTPLNAASYSGHSEIVKFLVGKRADLSASDNKGWTPLHMASNRGHLEIARFLVHKKADINIRSNSGWSPLNMASGNGHLEIVKLLVNRGADINTTEDCGWTPLNTASYNGHLEIVKFLVDKRADMNSRNHDGGTSLNMASLRGHLEIARFLIDRGADITTRDYAGYTPLMAAASNGRLELVRLLSKHPDVDWDCKDNHGRNAIFHSARAGARNTVEYLLRGGFLDLSNRDHYGASPLLAAVRNGHEKVAELLLGFDASDVDSCDTFGQTLSWWAKRSGNPGLVQLLSHYPDNASCQPKEIDMCDANEENMWNSELPWCDICTRALRDEPRYQCEVCDGGVFCICMECVNFGMRCPGYSHTLKLENHGGD